MQQCFDVRVREKWATTSCKPKKIVVKTMNQFYGMLRGLLCFYDGHGEVTSWQKHPYSREMKISMFFGFFVAL